MVGNPRLSGRREMGLKEKNPHKRDKYVTEHPDYAHNHIYLIRGKSHLDLGYKSVTTFIKQFFEEFDADATIEKYYDNWQKRGHPEYAGKTPDEIKKLWDAKRDDAASDGTYMHEQFELYHNGEEFDDTIDEFNAFLTWENQNILAPYRTEMTVYAPKWKLVGNIDLIAIDNSGDMIIVDYKRAEPKSSTFGKVCKEPLNMPHNDDTKHTLQLNIYKKILEEYYGFKIKGLYNLYIKGDDYKYIRRPNISNMDDILNY